MAKVMLTTALNLALIALLIPGVAQAWTFVLADTVRVDHRSISLANLSKTELPAEVADMVVGQASQPGSKVVINRRTLLRQLVAEGQAAGVSFRGPNQCVVIRTGTLLSPDSLREDLRRALQPRVPSSLPGAPSAWFELEMPQSIPAVAGQDYQVGLAQNMVLQPGRHQVKVQLHSSGDLVEFPVTVVLHQFNETARARLKIKRGDVLNTELFNWEWTDLALAKQKTDLYGREALQGTSCSRTISAGNYLRYSDLKATPMVFAGDRVELTVLRGGLAVSVPATARQEGSVGQTIPVINELTKRLVNARVKGPGLVEWRN